LYFLELAQCVTINLLEFFSWIVSLVWVINYAKIFRSGSSSFVSYSALKFVDFQNSQIAYRNGKYASKFVIFEQHVSASWTKQIFKKFHNLTKRLFLIFRMHSSQKSTLVSQFKSDRSDFFAKMFVLVLLTINVEYVFEFRLEISTKNPKWL
jgi:hypothetical protein